MVPVTFSVVNYLLYDIILWVDFWRKQGLNIGFTFIPVRRRCRYIITLQWLRSASDDQCGRRRLAQIPQHVTQQASKERNNSTGNCRSCQIYVTCISRWAAAGVRPDAIDTCGSVTTSVTKTVVGPRFTHRAHVFPTYKRSYVYKIAAQYKHKELK